MLGSLGGGQINKKNIKMEAANLKAKKMITIDINKIILIKKMNSATSNYSKYKFSAKSYNF